MRRRVVVETRVKVEVKPRGATGGERVRGKLLENWGFSGEKDRLEGVCFRRMSDEERFPGRCRGVTHWLVNRDCPVKSE